MSIHDQDPPQDHPRDRSIAPSDSEASARPGSPRRISLPIVDEAMAATESVSGAVREQRKYWRSISEKEGSPKLAAAAAREFPPGASELPEVSRRSFMKLFGGGAAVAGLAACHPPQEQGIPFVRRPEEVTPGNALHFATAYGVEGYSLGLIVESHEGRPTKVEGNPDHHDSLGGTGRVEQALLQGLYDNDRAKQLKHNGEPLTWRTFLGQMALLSARHAADGGAKLRFLTDPTASPLQLDLRKRILEKFPKARFTSYSSIAGDGAAEGLRLAFGKYVEARHELTRASVIVSLDADFLEDGPEAVRALHAEFIGQK